MKKSVAGFDAAALQPVAALPETLFDGPGEMRALCRAFDWSSVSLGPVADWPRTLRGLVAMMMASSHPMFLWWGPGLVQIYNDAYRPSFGEGPRHPASLGMGGAECWTEIWPIIGPQIAQVLSGGSATWHENHLVPILRNGHLEDVYWTYSYNPAFDDRGAIGGVLVICQETTVQVRESAERDALIESERAARLDAEAAREEMGLIFAQAPVAVAVLEGRELRYTVANPRYRKVIGNRDPVGKTLVEMFPELAGSPIEGVLERVFDSAIPFVANDHLIRFDSAGEGTIDNYYDLVYHPLVGTGGLVTGIIVICIDVTERRRALLEWQDMLDATSLSRAEAIQANRSKSEFLAMMSHELRTPLNAIGGYADLLILGIHGPVTTDQLSDLHRIKSSYRHLLGLVNGVLNFARVEAGHVDYARTDLLLDDVLATCEALVAPQARAKHIRLDYAGCAHSATAYADPEKVRQVVLNLLSNAVNFTEPAGIVTLACAQVEDEAHIIIRDTGCGIPPEQLSRIFDPFVQVDARLTRTRDGVGLGLAISRQLARGMGGELTVESAVDVGSVFTLALPARRAPSPGQATARTNLDSHTGG